MVPPPDRIHQNPGIHVDARQETQRGPLLHFQRNPHGFPVLERADMHKSEVKGSLDVHMVPPPDRIHHNPGIHVDARQQTHRGPLLHFQHNPHDFPVLERADVHKPDLKVKGSLDVHMEPPPDRIHHNPGIQVDARKQTQRGPLLHFQRNPPDYPVLERADVHKPDPKVKGSLDMHMVPPPNRMHCDPEMHVEASQKTQRGPIHFKHDPPDKPVSLMPVTDGSHPNDGIHVCVESLLPLHQAFRPNMESPRVHPGPLSSRMLGKRGITKEEVLAIVNSEVEECIKTLSSKGKFVPEHTVKQLAIDIIYQACRGNSIRIKWYAVKAAIEYSKLHGRTNELIKVYCQFTPITTLHDLGLAIADVEKTSEYDNLCLGPLVRHPFVKDLFKPPDDLETPPEITVYQLYKYVKMMTARRMNSSGTRFTIEDYLEFVRKKEGVESILHLCIRIRSFPLLLQVQCHALYLCILYILD